MSRRFRFPEHSTSRPLAGLAARTGGTLQAAVLAALLALTLGACSESLARVKTPPRIPYYEGQSLKDQGLYNEAVTQFQKVIDENPGSLLSTFAHLQLAEINLARSEWVQAETSYRQFLAANPQSHLTPYVLSQLTRLNHLASYTGLFFPEREYDRDMQPNRQIIQEYKRFFFLYPQSIFRDEVRTFADAARETLAENERMVGDFYFDRDYYNSAAQRYLYLLRNYPDYPERDAVYERLLEAYRRNQQPELAEELERASRAAAPPPEEQPAATGAAGANDAPPTGGGASATAGTARR